MTEQAAEATLAAATETSEQQEEKASKPKPTETVEFWKQKAREQEQRAKANAEAATKLQQYEDRDKTETQRLGEAADAFQKRAVEAEARALRLEVAAEKGLTPAQAKRLVGDNREDLEADADDLLANFKPPASAEEQTATRVAADLDLGTRGATTSATKSPADEFASILRGQLGS